MVGQSDLNPQTGGGSNPTPSLHFSLCQLKDVSAFVKEYHYSHTHHKVVVYAFSLLMNGVLAGACLFGMECITIPDPYEIYAREIRIKKKK
jgi:hypothetical protein